jgi:prepilin-type N-terminal cleavage/methylation domain-containing protein
MKQTGFTLIEIAIVVLIIALLAVVAVPTYKRYVIEAKLADVLEYADAAALAFTDYYQETGECPTVELAGLQSRSPIPHIATVSRSLDRNPCRDWMEIYLEIDGDSEPALKMLDRDRVMMRGYLGAEGEVKWTCGFSRYTPEVRQYLPSTCQEELL